MRSITSTLALACLFALPVFTNAQSPTNCLTLGGAICNGPSSTMEHFTTGDGGFTAAGNIAYNTTDRNFRNSTTTPGIYTATLTSPAYNKGSNFSNNIQAGFTMTSGNKVDVASVTLNILDAATNNIIATCTLNTPAAGQLCFGLNDADIVDGMMFRYQFVINYTITGPGQTNLTFDSFGYSTVSNAPLPVHFTSFDARYASNHVKLVWGIEEEENVKAYEVQRSADGKSFATIGSVDATASSSYSFNDAAPLSGSAYYRIKSIDFDGKYMYSGIVSLKGGKSSVVLRAFPMPAANEITIEHASAVRGSSMTLSTGDGKVVKTIAVSQGTMQTKINISSLSAGMYILQYNDAVGASQNIKIIKQ